MIPIAEILPWEPTALWKLAVQAGATHAVGYFHAPPGAEPLPERPWEPAPLAALKDRFERAGLELAVMEFREELEERGGLSRGAIEDRVRVKRAQLTVEAEREAEKEKAAAAASAAAGDDAKTHSRCGVGRLHCTNLVHCSSCLYF